MLRTAIATVIAAAAGQWALDSSDARWIGGVLRALQEPFLHDKVWHEEAEIYRLLVLPTFDHPILVRVTRWPGDKAAATMRSSSGSGGYDPGRLSFERAFVVSSADVHELRNAMKEIDLWSMKTSIPPTTIEHPDGGVQMIVCADGTTVVIEAVASGNYHIVRRHCDQYEQLRPVVSIFERLAQRELIPPPQ